MRLLLVEDEPELREALAGRLRDAGYTLSTAADGEEGLYHATEYPFDAAIVDLGLPRLSGIELIRRAREDGATFPILILTARGRWQDKVEGLEAGADDYLVKPFQYEELEARIHALLRRAAGWASSTLTFGPLVLDTRAKRVTVSGEPVELTAYEYNVLEYLALHAGKAISKSELTEHIYDQDFDRDSNVIEVFVGRLRRKLDPDGTLEPIETVRGQGYRFALAASTT
ncbi:MAG: response regulator transcription factor [Gammaproteobacteria bacterium]|nr:response regulator transcription factor [Gammaproteobacteria bacterium]